MTAPSVDEFEKLIGHLLNQQNLFAAANIYNHELSSATKDKDNAISAVISAYRAALGEGWHDRENADETDKPDPERLIIADPGETPPVTGYWRPPINQDQKDYNISSFAAVDGYSLDWDDIVRWRYLDPE